MSTTLSMRDHRRRALYALLLDPENHLLTVGDVHARLAQRWMGESIDTALADLAADGLVAEGPHGELIVGPNAHEEAA